MKVIKKNPKFDLNEFKKKVLCKTCKSELEIDGNDIKLNENIFENIFENVFGTKTLDYFWKCCVCETKNNISRAEIPKMLDKLL
jgi:hypothetical protein